MDEDAVAQQPLRSNRDQIVVVNLFARSSSILVVRFPEHHFFVSTLDL
jgi:hypothetical protein